MDRFEDPQIIRFVGIVLLGLPTLLWWVYSFWAIALLFSGAETDWGLPFLVLVLVLGWVVLLLGWRALFDRRWALSIGIALFPFLGAMYALANPGTYLNLTLGM